MSINFKKYLDTVFSSVKITLFSKHDDNSYFDGLSKAVREVDPTQSNAADELYKAIKASMDVIFRSELHRCQKATSFDHKSAC